MDLVPLACEDACKTNRNCCFVHFAVPIDSFPVMSGQSNSFLGIHQSYGKFILDSGLTFIHKATTLYLGNKFVQMMEIYLLLICFLLLFFFLKKFIFRNVLLTTLVQA